MVLCELRIEVSAEAREAIEGVWEEVGVEEAGVGRDLELL